MIQGTGRSGYLYAGFRDPWWKITGDAYYTMCAIPPEEENGQNHEPAAPAWDRSLDRDLVAYVAVHIVRAAARHFGVSERTIARQLSRIRGRVAA